MFEYNISKIDNTMKLLEGKVALVTGAGRGIGKAIALRFAQEGANVAFTDLAINEAVEETVKEIEAMGVKAKAYASNAANFDETHEVVKQIVEDFGRIDVLVNNAGIRRDNVMFMMPDEDWHSVIDVTLNGFFYVTRHLLPKMMMRRHGGRIVNMASLSGLKGMAGQTNYSAAKAALIGATKALAQEAAARNVTVNAVAPGFIETDMTKDLPQDELKQLVPMRRFGKPEEVASLVGFLCSDEASYITGEVISINGGLY